MKIIALKWFQSRILSYLQIIIDKNYYRQENKKKYLKNLLGQIKTISSQIHNDIIEMQHNDLLFDPIIKSIDSLLESVKQESELTEKDIIEKVKVTVKVQELVQQDEYKYYEQEVYITKRIFTESVSLSEIMNFIQQHENYKYYCNEISDIWIELYNMSNLIDSDVLIYIENALLGKDIDGKIEIEIPPTWILPTSQCTDVLQILDDGFKEGLIKDQIFLNKLMVSSRIEQTFESWANKINSNVQKRISILKEAITAHLERKYYLSVSTLIPQIEGLLKDAVQEADITGVNLDKLDSGSIANATNKLAIKWKEQNRNIDNFGCLLYRNENFSQVTAYLYKQYDSKIDTENFLNRHGICHGSQTNFGTAKSSLRLILIIDRIIFFMADDKNDN